MVFSYPPIESSYKIGDLFLYVTTSPIGCHYKAVWIYLSMKIDLKPLYKIIFKNADSNLVATGVSEYVVLLINVKRIVGIKKWVAWLPYDMISENELAQ